MSLQILKKLDSVSIVIINNVFFYAQTVIQNTCALLLCSKKGRKEVQE